MINKDNILLFLNKRKAEAKAHNQAPLKKQSQAKKMTDSPSSQGPGDIGKFFRRQNPLRDSDRASGTDERPGEDRACDAYYERP
eukprot:10305137-Heterocapsa_arctica.AAC.1